MIAELGGYLGLFPGYSLMNISIIMFDSLAELGGKLGLFLGYSLMNISIIRFDSDS